MRPTRRLLTLSLDHLHLPGLTPYTRAAAVQEQVVRKHLDYKANPIGKHVPNPCLFTFQTPPTYTCGRREIGTLSPKQIQWLQDDGKADFYEVLRGGQLTFHGPGQLTAYLVCSLKQHGLTTRSYVEFLETCVMTTLENSFGMEAHTDAEHPGVWVTDEAEVDGDKTEKKIASIGVHLRRNITSHGVGLNLTTDLGWFERITACGLPGNLITSVEAQAEALQETAAWDCRSAVEKFDLAARGFADVVQERLDGVEGVLRRGFANGGDEEVNSFELR